MQLPPINFQDLSMLLAVIATMLLATSEVLSTRHEKLLLLDKKRLHLASLIIGMLFLATVAINIATIILSFHPS